MPPWKVKAAAQGVVSVLPQPHRWNRYLQQCWTHTRSFDDGAFATHLAHFRFHRRVLRHRDLGTTGVFELGTGSVPVTPLALWLAGTGAVVSWDVVDQWNDRLAGQAAAHLLTRVEERRFSRADPARVSQLSRALGEQDGRLSRKTVGRLGISTFVGDASRTGLDDGGVDVFVSNATLEHIPGPHITGIFTEFARLAAPGAQMSHYIDLSDHYSSFDHRINAFHYLRYDSHAWRKYNNQLHYQNRLRICDYREIHDATGWRITREALVSGAVSDLDDIPVATEFNAYSLEDLLVHRAVVASRRAGRH